MDEQKVKRTRRTPEQKAADVDAKIQKLNQDLEGIEVKRTAANEEFDKKAAEIKEKINAFEQMKADILTPKPRKPRKTKKQKVQEIINLASKSGLKPEEIAARLGIGQAEE